jgi:2-keto-3-deoxy-L-rhamnonate aldolase RhmA
LQTADARGRVNGKAGGVSLPYVNWILLPKELGYTFIAYGADRGYVMNGVKAASEVLRMK